MKTHRLVTMILMTILAIGALALMLAGAARSLDGRSWIALAVVVAGAAAGGVAFSWKRYFPKKG
jgi:uncharacterized protein YfiM (DUF2279 family)